MGIKGMDRVYIRTIEKKYEAEAYSLWKYGMSKDLIELWIKYFFKNTVFKFVAICLALGVKYGVKSGLVLFLGITAFYILMCWYLSTDYIGSRTDLKSKSGELVIEKNWGERFLVAVIEENKKERVVGTVSYKNRDTVSFKGLEYQNLVELFSLNVRSSARGLGIGAKLCNAVEEVAKKSGRDLYLETSMGQIPAIKLYLKLGYEDDTIPFRTGNSLTDF